MSLVVKNLVKIYSEKKVVNNVSFEVKPGKVYGILGRNGAGKTTIIRMILTIINKDGGEILFNGNKIDVLKSKIGYLPEEKILYNKSTVKEYLTYFAMLSGLKYKNAKESINYWIDRFNLQEKYNNVLDTLSKGNQQKVQIISTIINDPNIIIFDEPFSGLDPVNSEIFRNIVIELISKGKYILFSTHQMNYVEEFCDSISILKNGNQIVEGNILNIKKKYCRKKLLLEIDGNLPDLRISGVSSIEKNKGIYNINILNENVGEHILNILFQHNVKILNFNLKYKSLHEIFLDVVGD